MHLFKMKLKCWQYFYLKYSRYHFSFQFLYFKIVKIKIIKYKYWPLKKNNSQNLGKDQLPKKNTYGLI